MDEYTVALVGVELELLLPELLDACGEYRRAKARYRRARDRYRGDQLQDILTGQDRSAKKAVADCSWYGQEVARLAAAVTALTLVSRRRPG